jgi:hypothetical protein
LSFLAGLRPRGSLSDSRRSPAMVKVRPNSAATIDLKRRFLNPSSQVARVLLVSAASCVVVQARDARTSFNVSATVNAVAKLQVQSAPTEILVSDEDLRRGFIDVAQPTALVIRSNSANGYALDLTTLAPLFSSVVVRGLTSEQSLGGEGGTIVQRWHAPQTVNLSLQFRLMLAPGLAAGRYPWPMRIDVRPLESL